MNFLELSAFGVMLILAIASVWSWAIAIDKWLQFGDLESHARKFERQFWSGRSIDDLDDSGSDRPRDALSRVFAAAALGLVVLWCEAVPQRLDRLLLWPSLLLLCLPSLVLALGQYRLFLLAGQTGTAVALFLAHLMPVMAYVVIMLIVPYRAHDPRWQASAAGLQATRARFLLRVKWPMLKAPLLSAFAVGFAVSVAQYAPAQLVAAGRFSTLPMEAVTLASGGDRAVAASYGVMLALLPLVVFIGSGLLSRPRWSNV